MRATPPAEPGRLEPIAGGEIVLHRRAHLGRQPSSERTAARRSRRRARRPARAPTRHVSRIAARTSRAGRDPRARRRAAAARGASRRTARARNTNFSHSALPDVGARSRSRCPPPCTPPRTPRACGARPRVERAEVQPRHRAGVRDHARARDRRGDVGDAAQHLVVAEHALQRRRAVDAVLERDDDAAAGQQRRELPARAARCPTA